MLTGTRARVHTGILVVDDHPVVREGTSMLVERDAGMELLGYARTGAEAIDATARLQPDLVLLDLCLPDMLAPEVTLGLLAAQPTVRVLLFTAYADHAALQAALGAGAHGCLLKDATRTDLLRSIRRVAGGEQVIDPRIGADDTPDPAARPVGGDAIGLTTREYDVLRRVALGETNPEIAEALDLTRNTVKSYLQSAFGKLDARNRVEAIIRARDAGLL
jgi:two-component system, NarL family, nitrate/nitrite response regulator NarL